MIPGELKGAFKRVYHIKNKMELIFYLEIKSLFFFNDVEK